MSVIRAKREESVKPLRRRESDLQEQLKHVEQQIAATHSIREARRNNQDLEQELEDEVEEDVGVEMNPPPYSPYWKEQWNNILW